MHFDTLLPFFSLLASLLAQVPTAAPDDITKVFLSLMAIMVFVERGIALWRSLQPKPPTPPTADFERIEKLIAAVDTASKERRDASKTEISNVRNDLDSLRRDHSEVLDRRFGSLERRIEGLDNRLGDVLTAIAKFMK